MGSSSSSAALAGASVIAADGLGHFGATTSGEDGSFAIDDLPPVSIYDVSAALHGYFDVTVEGVDPGAEGVVIVLPRNFARIAGRLIPLGDGVVLSDVRVVATNTAMSAGYRWRLGRATVYIQLLTRMKGAQYPGCR